MKYSLGEIIMAFIGIIIGFLGLFYVFVVVVNPVTLQMRFLCFLVGLFGTMIITLGLAWTLAQYYAEEVD